jgi:hypothetical protein
VLPYACICLALICPISGNKSCDYRTAPQKSTRREAVTLLDSRLPPLSDEMSPIGVVREGGVSRASQYRD